MRVLPVTYSGPTTTSIGNLATADKGDCGLQLILPVSYTHLRAHETVLDLVCRLLLEKKKVEVKSIVSS